MGPELLTIDQAAKRLNVSPAYVRRRLIFERRISYVKIGRHVRIDRDDLEELIDRGRIPSPGDQENGRDTRSRERQRGRPWLTSGSTR